MEETVNSQFKWLEKQFSILALIFFSEALDMSSLSVHSDPSAAIEMGVQDNPISSLIRLIQAAVYGITIILLGLRFKRSLTVVFRDFFVFGLVILVLLSPLWSDFPDMSRQFSILSLSPTFFGIYFASRYPVKEQIQILAIAMAITAIFSLAYSLALPSFAIETGANAGAWRGPFVQKNIMGRIMVLTNISISLLAPNSMRGIQRYIIWIGAGASLLLMLLCNSKTSIIIFLTLLMLRLFYTSIRWSKSRLIPFSIILILIVGCSSLFGITNFEEITLSLGKDPSLSGRTYLWQAVLEQISLRPALGYGFSAFWTDGGGADYVWQAIADKAPHAHNGFINITVELGLIGLALYTASLLWITKRSYHFVRVTQSVDGLWPILYVTFLFLFNQTESTIISFRSLFWALHCSVSFSLGRFLLAEMSNNLRIKKSSGDQEH
jgi:exopolysaccharide production protein ExoQ